MLLFLLLLFLSLLVFCLFGWLVVCLFFVLFCFVLFFCLVGFFCFVLFVFLLLFFLVLRGGLFVFASHRQYEQIYSKKCDLPPHFEVPPFSLFDPYMANIVVNTGPMHSIVVNTGPMHSIVVNTGPMHCSADGRLSFTWYL